MSAGRKSLAGRASSAAGAYAAQFRARRNRFVDAAAPRVAERLYRWSNRVAFVPFRSEAYKVPPPLEVDGVRVDVVDDLAAYSGLEGADVRRVLERRDQVSFRSEWWQTPEALRRDHWFYLSSKTYLFGNAVHFPGTEFVDRYVVPFVPPGGTVLDYGGGAGGLTLALAARGFRPVYRELNALQRDFMRFRLERRGLADRVRVMDWWENLGTDLFDAILAIDVFEHLQNAAEQIAQLLDSLRRPGTLVEQSPFVLNASNPMHHDDFGLEAMLEGRALTLVLKGPDAIRVWQGAKGAD